MNYPATVPSVRSWFPITPVHLGQLYFSSDTIKTQVLAELEKLPKEKKIKLNPWEDVDATMRSLVNLHSYVFVEESDPLGEWETILLDKAPAKFVVVEGIEEGYHLQFDCGDVNLRFGDENEGHSSDYAKDRVVFSGHLHFRNENLMEKVLSDLQAAEIPTRAPLWISDLAAKEGWSFGSLPPEIKPWLLYHVFMERLLTKNSGWNEKYLSVAKAITSETMKEWEKDLEKGVVAVAEYVRAKAEAKKKSGEGYLSCPSLIMSSLELVA
ncbi:hypothetical protein F5878DRAFT_647977 [Lentinula raphanica]|uniref:Uncharacterized protein n=1 Tax=Lentinula raphanica TaxID=153919 RepID=A0AA38U2H0_9AGAR|nr:hypothetical protein F5878DRAFT_647977 [Lentinula raphanica]